MHCLQISKIFTTKKCEPENIPGCLQVFQSVLHLLVIDSSLFGYVIPVQTPWQTMWYEGHANTFPLTFPSQLKKKLQSRVIYIMILVVTMSGTYKLTYFSTEICFVNFNIWLLLELDVVYGIQVLECWWMDGL